MPLAGADAVANPFGNELALKLREREQDIEDQPTHAVRGVERLRDRDQPNPLSIKDLNQPHEVEQAPGEPINLVDNDRIHLTCFDVLHELGQCRTLQAAPRMASVIIGLRHFNPAAVLLALDVGRANFPLRRQRIDVPVEQAVGAFPGVNGTSFQCLNILRHSTSPREEAMTCQGRSG